jgi:hypothetical protein
MNDVDTQKLAYEYTVWVAPEMLALLEKGLIYMEKYPFLFEEGEISHTKENIEEFKEIIENAKSTPGA